MGNANIIGINGGKHKNGPEKATALPAPIIKLRDCANLNLKDLIRSLFDSADDAFFEMADKAGSNGDQSMYFDAMRELRLQKKKIAMGLIQAINASFSTIEESSYQNRTTDSSSNIDSESLSLIHNDELELNVAKDGMITRLNNSAGSELDALHKRMESVLSFSFSQTLIPTGPELLCDAFFTACEILDVPLKARLVIFKLFEKHVLSSMNKVYIRLNELLIKQGVLPNLKLSTGKVTHQTSNPQSTGTLQNHNETPDDQSHIPILNADQCLSGGQFENLRSLMHNQVSDAFPVIPTTPVKAEYFHQNDIVSALSQLQHQQLGQSINLEHESKFDYSSLLNNLMQTESTNNAYSPLDTDVMNLVSMLFDFILDDRQLQPDMKALIARLQIPILKVAIMDSSFFDRGGHPARKLLNEMASAAIGWNKKTNGKRDRLKEKIEGLVSSILANFDNEISLFESLLQDFTSFIDLEQRRGLLVEQRTKDSEKGKAASDVAKHSVEAAINDLIQDKAFRDKKLPACVLDILSEAWSRVMTIHFLKGGEDSREWKRACKVASELIWSVCPEGNNADARQKLLHQIPLVMRNLRQGLNDISFDEFRMKTLFKALENEHVKTLHNVSMNESECIKGTLEPIESVPDTVSELNDAQDDAIAELVRDTLEMEEEFKHFKVANILPEAEPSSNESKAALFESSQLNASSDNVANKDDPFVQQVENLTVGCWFEFREETEPVRCKLAAVIKVTGKYIFVNRSGVKVAEKTVAVLADEMRRGCIQILNDGLLFDRALESVIGSLRHNSLN